MTDSVQDSSAELAVRQLASTYIVASKTGDAGSLRSIFHETAHMYGRIGDREIATPIQTFLDHVARTGACDETYAGVVEAISISGPTGVAVVTEQNFHGRNYRDVFGCAQFGTAWLIVSKLFSVVD